ncbi:hypothetical protein N7526_011407 [Penicillium atrosanguineum]|nr:hypothetical protein N7526_011407 [Penicillium atrosanguineum]
MSTRQSTPMSDHSHTDGIRKRCVQSVRSLSFEEIQGIPCSRCRADNTVCVFGERKKPHDKVYPKGYVEMLEQQQSWLVHGLQVLYHRAIEDESWSEDLLKAETNGHPLTHDILTRLGVLDGSKVVNGTREPYSPVACSSFRPDALSHQEMPPTPPTYNTVPSLHTPIKSEPSSHSPQYGLSLQGVDGPLGSQQWPTNGFSSVDNFSLFDDMEMNTNADYMGLPFDNHIPSPMFDRQALMDSVASNDYEDFNQFLNTNPADILRSKL